MKRKSAGTQPPPRKTAQRKFPYLLNHYPNPNIIGFDARSRFPTSDTMDGLDLAILNDRSKRKRIEEEGRGKINRHPLYVTLSKIKGLKSASGRGYHLQIEKANSLFSWDELLPKIMAAIQETVAGKRQMVDMRQVPQK